MGGDRHLPGKTKSGSLLPMTPTGTSPTSREALGSAPAQVRAMPVNGN